MSEISLLTDKKWKKAVALGLTGLAGVLTLYGAGVLSADDASAATIDNYADAVAALERLEIQVNDANTGFGVPFADMNLKHLDQPETYNYDAQSDAAGLGVFLDPYTYVDNDGTLVPVTFDLEQNYPNPFNPSTVIPFSTQTAGDVDVRIYNNAGQLVRHLVDQELPAGKHRVIWGGADDKGEIVANGIYYAKMTAGDFTETIKMINYGGNGSGRGVETLENHGAGYDMKKAANSGEKYILTISKDGYETRIDSSVVINENTGRLTYELMPVAVNNPPDVSLNDRSILEDQIAGIVYDMWEETTDESPDSSLTYEIISETDPDLVSFEIENNRYLKMKTLKADASGYSDITLRVTDPEGDFTDVTFRQTVVPQADITGTLKDPVSKENVTNVKTYFNGTEVVSDDSGRISVQVPEGNYLFKTDTTGGRMETQWDLGQVGTEDFNLDTLLKDTPLQAIPVAWKNGNMVLMIDVKRHYGGGDGETFAVNKIWDPNKVYEEGLPKGTLKTVYVNYSALGEDQLRKDNLDWAVVKSRESTDDKIRLQMPADAYHEDISANSAAEEAQIVLKFMRGEILQDYDTMVLVTNYIGDTNVSNANNVEGYTTRGYAGVSGGNLGAARGATLSELTTLVTMTGDVTRAKEDMAAGTMWGRAGTVDHDQGYVQTVSYGPPGGVQVMYSPEQHLGKLMMNIPLDTIIKREKFELPKVK